jgi:hypothetical protein
VWANICHDQPRPLDLKLHAGGATCDM